MVGLPGNKKSESTVSQQFITLPSTLAGKKVEYERCLESTFPLLTRLTFNLEVN